jgi:heme exporter protein D
MPELGKYAGEVLSSYGASLLLLLALVLVSLRSARKAKEALDQLEKGRKDG